MSNDLHSLAYFSRNTMTGSGPEVEAQIAQILASARVNNHKRGVSGALLFSQGCFAQVLEGELGDVEAIYNRILPDPRHADIRILQFTPIQVRSFGQWSMAYAGQDATGAARLDVAGLLSHPARIASGTAGHDVVDVLREIIGQYEGAAAAE